MSWDEAFAQRYDEWSAHMTEDVAFYVDLAREADGVLVELAVGNGRVAIPVSRETGSCVIGIDSSPAMLQQARERAAREGVDLGARGLPNWQLDYGSASRLLTTSSANSIGSATSNDAWIRTTCAPSASS